MKHIRTIGLFFIILMLFARSLFAQENEIGFDIGYGKTKIEDYGRPLVLPFDKELPDYLRVGFCYYYTPNKAIFSIKTGLTYDYKGQNNDSFNYLRAPLGLDFHFGRKVQLIVGAGFYISYLIAYSGIYNDYDFEDYIKRLQIGWQGNVGLGFQIYTRYNLSIVYQNNFDITKMYEDHRMSPGGNKYSLDEKGYDGFIMICLKYNLINE